MKSFICLAAVILAALWSPVLSTQEPERQQVKPATADNIRTRHFELVDETGRVRIEMGMDKGNPMIKLNDENGKERVTIFQQAEATGIYIKDADEHTRVGLAQFPHGGGVAMHGSDGKGSAVYVLINDRARMEIYDRDGKRTSQWPAREEK